MSGTSGPFNLQREKIFKYIKMGNYKFWKPLEINIQRLLWYREIILYILDKED